ncbi:lipopolysaccharide-binding protein-like [Oculina patagonica]
MKSMANVLFVSTLMVFISDCYSMEVVQVKTHPGIRLRVTNNGLQYVDDVGIEALVKRLRSDDIKDFSGADGSFKYTAYNIKNTYTKKGSSSLSTAPGEGLIFQATGFDLEYTGKVKYDKKFGWIRLRDTVDVNFKAHGIGFTLKVRIGADSAGRPTVSTLEQDCSSVVDSVDVHFSGSRASMIYNAFSGQIENKVKDQLKKMICEKADEAINSDGANYMATFPVHSDISTVAQIDNSLVANPTFNSKYMDVPLKGEFKSRKNPHPTSLIAPQTLPSFTEADKMVYIWVTDYVFNTASLVYHEEGVLRKTIRPEDLPQSSKFPLNTKSFKLFLYKLYEKYPDRPVFFKGYTTKAPVFTSRPSGTNVTVTGNVEVYVTAKNGAHVYALTVGLKADVAGSLGVKSGNLTFHTKSFTAQVHLVRSAIGDIKFNIGLLQWFLNGVIEDGHFVNKLNVIGDRGFPLPMLRNILWEDTAISTGQGFTLIETNLKYLASTDAE